MICLLCLFTRKMFLDHWFSFDCKHSLVILVKVDLSVYANEITFTFILIAVDPVLIRRM